VQHRNLIVVSVMPREGFDQLVNRLRAKRPAHCQHNSISMSEAKIF
jgi:hypothetical protein